MGAAGAMRRQAIAPISKYVRGRDQRQLKLLDIACGSGRFLHQLAQAFPAMHMTGTDLSQAYLVEAARYLQGRRTVAFQQANAETLPFGNESFDIVTCIYLYHELPNEVRRRVTAEMARVLKPGGLFVFVDSLQWGDVEAYDGLLEAFPQRFHEPYYLDYLQDRLGGAEGVFAQAGLRPDEWLPAFLSKVIVCHKDKFAREPGQAATVRVALPAWICYRSKAVRAAKAWRRSGSLAFADLHGSGGREAEGGGLLNRCTVEKPYRGFESLPLRQFLQTHKRTYRN